MTPALSEMLKSGSVTLGDTLAIDLVAAENTGPKGFRLFVQMLLNQTDISEVTSGFVELKTVDPSKKRAIVVYRADPENPDPLIARRDITVGVKLDRDCFQKPLTEPNAEQRKINQLRYQIDLVNAKIEKTQKNEAQLGALLATPYGLSGWTEVFSEGTIVAQHMTEEISNNLLQQKTALENQLAELLKK